MRSRIVPDSLVRDSRGDGGSTGTVEEAPLPFDPIPGTVDTTGWVSAVGAVKADPNPRAGVSPSNPEPPSGSPPREANDIGPAPVGGSGCRREPIPEPTSLLGLAGGDSDAPPPVPAPAAPAALTPDTAFATPLDPEFPAAAAVPAPARALAPPASAPTPAATEAAATPALATITPVEIKSPPVSAGPPPRTAAKSFGICQHSIIKISAAPITSKAVMLG